MDLGDFVERVERYQTLVKLKLPSFKVFKELYSMEQTRVVTTLIEIDIDDKKIHDLSMNILKYALSHRDKVKVDDKLLSQLYKKYQRYFDTKEE